MHCYQNHCFIWRLHRQLFWGVGSVSPSPVLGLTPAASAGTGVSGQGDSGLLSHEQSQQSPQSQPDIWDPKLEEFSPDTERRPYKLIFLQNTALSSPDTTPCPEERAVSPYCLRVDFIHLLRKIGQVWEEACPHKWTATESGSLGPPRKTDGHLLIEPTRHAVCCWTSMGSRSCVGIRSINGLNI